MSNTPVLTFPEKEADHVRRRYNDANTILEYGSGGSSYLGASMAGKLVLSVESDRDWAIHLQRRIDSSDLPSAAIIQYVDIGDTGDWGRPKDATSWNKFYRYPTSIWHQPYFRNPDLILIDGRFRAACFVAAFLRIKKPTTILFDDYCDRELYHVVEELAQVRSYHGRMAEFHIEPGERPIWIHDMFNELLGDVNFDDGKYHNYKQNHDTCYYPFNQSFTGHQSSK